VRDLHFNVGRQNCRPSRLTAVAASSMTTAAASVENWQSLDGYSIYDARALAAGVAFCFTAAINVFAVGPEEAGFCPVISKPSLTT
jgi:hypothetical protein